MNFSKEGNITMTVDNSTVHVTMLMNNTSENSTLDSELSCLTESPDTDLTKAWKTIIYCVIILVSLVGNTLVIIVVIRRKSMKTTTNFLIVNMAVSDLLFALFTTPPSIRNVYAGEDLLVRGIIAELVCKLVTFIQQVSIAVSILSLTSIAFDRFFAITLPFREVITDRITKIIIALTWLIGVLFAAPLLYTNRVAEGSDGTFCLEVWEPLFNSSKAKIDYTFITFSFLYAGPLAIIAILYAAIVIELWRGNSIKFRSKANYHEVEKSNRKVFKMLVTVIVVFALFWLPVYIFQFMFYVGNSTCIGPGLIQYFGYFLCQATSAVNPLIYAIFSENYRSGFKDCFRAMLHCQGRKLLQSETSVGKSSVGGRHADKKRVELYIL